MVWSQALLLPSCWSLITLHLLVCESAQSFASLQEVYHTFIVNEAKTSSPPPPSNLLPPPFIQFGPLFQLKPLKSLLLSCDPRLQALPTAFGSPASRSVPLARSQEDSPRRSERVGVWGDQSRKGRGDQRSSRRAALNRNVRDEIKSTGLEILLTQTHWCTHAHELYIVIFYVFQHDGTCFNLCL